jgi:5-(carboxyamino)imidazole ribonucleotide synthase
VVTYEWEGVPADSARFLARHHDVRPGARSLEVSQDRAAEKEAFRALGIPTPEFALVDTREQLDAAIEAVSLPAVLKTRHGGYDGKGQVVLLQGADVDPAWERLGGVPLVLEAFVAFERELSIVAVRDSHGTIGCWPLVENHHREGILHKTVAPAPAADAHLHARGDAIARSLLEDLGHVGVLAVELFEVGGELLANELAPRVHNSGHWTIEGAATSQFENHMRAVLDLPLGDTQEMGPSVMINCIGAMPDPAAVLTIEGAHLHDYGKSPRPGRKLGHVTVTGGDAEDVAARARTVEHLLR